jgi:hypothetical protein
LPSDPFYADAYIRRGLLRHQLGYYQSALADLNQGANHLYHQGLHHNYQQILALIEQVPPTVTFPTISESFKRAINIIKESKLHGCDGETGHYLEGLGKPGEFGEFAREHRPGEPLNNSAPDTLIEASIFARFLARMSRAEREANPHQLGF